MGENSKMLFLTREKATSLKTGFKLALFSLARYNEALNSPMKNTKTSMVEALSHHNL